MNGVIYARYSSEGHERSAGKGDFYLSEHGTHIEHPPNE